jgi:hypothetical protein
VAGCDPLSDARGCNNFTAKSKLPYCAEYARPVDADGDGAAAAAPYNGTQLPCAFFQTPLPAGTPLNGAILAMTRVHTTRQVFVCDDANDNCAQVFQTVGNATERCVRAVTTACSPTIACLSCMCVCVVYVRVRV